MAGLPVTVIRDPAVIAVNATIEVNGSIGNAYARTAVALLSTGTVSGYLLFSAITSSGSSAVADITGRTKHTVQHVITGTVCAHFRTSTDGVNWDVATVDRRSVIHSFEGLSTYASAVYVTGDGTLTTRLISSI